MSAEVIVNYGLKVVGVIALIFVGRIVAAFAGRWAEGLARRSKTDETVSRFIGKAARAVVMLLVVLSALGIFGIETTSFAAVIGAAGLAIGLAFQGTLSSIAAGVMLLTLRPFKVGDLITVGGYHGMVFEIGLFTVSLDTWDNLRIVLPNNEVFGKPLENHTHHERRRVEVDVGVDYGADLKKTEEVILAACATISDTLDEPQAYLMGLGASSVDWQARVWVAPERYLGVRAELTAAVKNHLDEAGLTIPFPQMDVHLGGGLPS